MNQLEKLQNLADKDSSGTLTVDELNSLFKKINLNISKKQIQKLMEPFGRKEITMDQFKDLYTRLSDIPVFHTLYENIKKLGFEQFWSQIQKDEGSTPTLEQFIQYLLDDKNNLYSFEKRKLCMDMNQPWYKYYMNSSHNTYLTGNQLSGESSTEAYVRALQMGCRCVELDCWDGPDGEPVITHGFTLTTKIFFKDVIEIVQKYAFVASPYPVVLSLEVHCDAEQQDRMADILTSILGTTLVTSRLDVGTVVSPENLKNRIILKGRAINQEVPVDEDSDKEETEEKEKPKPVKISTKLAALIVYQQAKKLNQVEDVHQFENHHVSSFSESKASRMIAKTFAEFLKFTNTAFARIFPLGNRVNSSNLDPVPYWQAGCQMVALNYQNFDKSMQINRGFFLQNNNCGYLLKPDRFPTASNVPIKLSVTVISAYFLPKPKNQLKGEIVDPFVKIELVTPGDEIGGPSASHVSKTEAVDDNGFNPVWYDLSKMKGLVPEPMLVVEKTVRNIEPCFLVFTIKDKDVTADDFLACGVVPVNCLREGYRILNLYDHKGNLLLDSHLFVYVSTS